MVPTGWSLIGVLCLATQGQLPGDTQTVDPRSVPSNRKCRVLNDTLQRSLLHCLPTKKIVTGCALIRKRFCGIQDLAFHSTIIHLTRITVMFTFSNTQCLYFSHEAMHDVYKIPDLGTIQYLFPYTVHIANVGSCYTKVLHKRCVITTRAQVWYAGQKQNNTKLNGMLTMFCFVKTH